MATKKTKENFKINFTFNGDVRDNTSNMLKAIVDFMKAYRSQTKIDLKNIGRESLGTIGMRELYLRELQLSKNIIAKVSSELNYRYKKQQAEATAKVKKILKTPKGVKPMTSEAKAKAAKKTVKKTKKSK